MFRIGIDLGGTKIEGVALDATGAELARRRIDTEAGGGPAHIVARIAGLYAGLVHAIDDMPHTLGMGTPGAISPKTGLLKNSNTVCLNGQPLRALLEAAILHPVAIENDANCFALAEALHGAGRGFGCVFGVIMGTGCGGGLVLDGRVRTGAQAIAGEWGHMVLDPAGHAASAAPTAASKPSFQAAGWPPGSPPASAIPSVRGRFTPAFRPMSRIAPPRWKSSSPALAVRSPT